MALQTCLMWLMMHIWQRLSFPLLHKHTCLTPLLQTAHAGCVCFWYGRPPTALQLLLMHRAHQLTANGLKQSTLCHAILLRIIYNSFSHVTLQAVFASGGEDHLVVIWSLDRAQAAAGGASSSKSVSRDAPSEVLFKHVGHRAGVSWHRLQAPCYTPS